MSQQSDRVAVSGTSQIFAVDLENIERHVVCMVSLYGDRPGTVKSVAVSMRYGTAVEDCVLHIDCPSVGVGKNI